MAEAQTQTGTPPDVVKGGVVAYLAVEGALKCAEFYKKAFGATETSRASGPDGKIINAQLRIGNSTMMLMEEKLDWGARSPKSLDGSPTSVQIYVEDADKMFAAALAAGATAKMPIEDAFWGDRYGSVVDPFGHEWSIATRVKDMTGEEMEAASKEFFAKMQNA